MRGKTVQVFGLLIVAAFAATGCGGGGKKWSYNNQVEGTVKLDGVPLAGVVVEFVPDDAQFQGPSSRSYTDENGRFKLNADNRKSGAVIAKHFVTVLPGRGSDPQAGDGQGRTRSSPKPSRRTLRCRTATRSSCKLRWCRKSRRTLTPTI